MMGALALAILWVTTLLIAAAALKELGPLRAVRRRAWERGVVARGDGPGAAIAVRRVEQVGRATDAGEVHFSDRAYTGEIFGGAVTLDSGGELAIEPTREAEVWPSASALAGATSPPDGDALGAALALAKKPKGLPRSVEARLGVGDVVFVAPGAPTVSAIDPRAWAAKKAALVVAFTVAEISAAALATAVALVPPAFGLVSKIGGALCLAFFLGVQPLGTAVREAVRAPSRAALRGVWKSA
jgi:hypothetical protein